MDNYRIANKKQLDEWFGKEISLGGDLRAIKGAPPRGAIYSDGTPCLNPINVAWECVQTGEVFAIEYALSGVE